MTDGTDGLLEAPKNSYLDLGLTQLIARATRLYNLDQPNLLKTTICFQWKT